MIFGSSMQFFHTWEMLRCYFCRTGLCESFWIVAGLISCKDWYERYSKGILSKVEVGDKISFVAFE